jgi:hypothetical protein
MKQENLKNRFIFKAINLLPFGNSFNKFFISDFFPQKKEFVTKYSFFKTVFAKWGNFPPKKSLYKTFQMTYGHLMRNCHVDAGEVLLK